MSTPAVVPGKFLSLEGLEGVGKTTNLEFIQETLQSAGVSVLVTREPGGTELGEALRSVLLHSQHAMQAETEMLMMAASRVEHVATVILPALASGQWVLSDRYLDASLAYQGGGREIGVQRVKDIHTLAGVTRMPDLTLLLDMPIALGRERIAVRNATDRIEAEADPFFERCRSAYLAVAKEDPVRVKVIDASKPLDIVQTKIAQILAPLLEETLLANGRSLG